MSVFQEEAKTFRRAKELQVAEARQCAVFFLASGIDLAAALKSSGKERTAILARLTRLIERERLKGMRRHWGYDLNRHIALKQVYDRLRVGVAGARELGAERKPPRRRFSSVRAQKRQKRHPGAPPFESTQQR
ncbi:hypothetical protein [Chelativorans xinjiangense]|uniref:hypothetical protein n=1 Tax=Chelativorans xinjiangense TaxID=2681485 RepID=UPI001FE9B39A|nr:hypothetical protein [Chelativorans xinjiangense]